jgi:hypothetical protein
MTNSIEPVRAPNVPVCCPGPPQLGLTRVLRLEFGWPTAGAEGADFVLKTLAQKLD